MKSALLLAVVVFGLSVCDRRPVQKDLPVKNAPQNSVDHSGKHNSAMKSSPGAASAPFQLQFIDTMIAHHEIAIDASQLVQTRAAHPELKSLASDIIRARQKEIIKMRALRNQHFADAPPAVNADLPGMKAAMEQMDLDKLDSLKENAFDIEFIRQMIPLHEGAVEMANFALSQPPLNAVADPEKELRALARSLVDTESEEVSKMKEWQGAWSKQP